MILVEDVVEEPCQFPDDVQPKSALFFQNLMQNKFITSL